MNKQHTNGEGRPIKPDYVDDEATDTSSSIERPKRRFTGPLLILLLAAIGVAGFGSSTGWFGLLEPDATSTTNSLGNITAAISAQLDEAAIKADAAQLPVLNVPSLDPLLPADGPAVLAEGKRVAKHLVSVTSGGVDALEMEARFEFEFGDPQQAKQLWTKVIESNPNYVYALRGLGDIATIDGELDKAVDFYRRAVLAEPRNISRQVKLATALTSAGELEEAVQQLNAILLVQPQSFSAQYQLGQVELLRKNFEAAKQAFEKALEIQPDHAESHYGLAQALIRLQDRESAKIHQQRHAELSAGQKEELKEGREGYDDLTALLIDVGALYTDMARVYLQSGYEKAAKLLLVRAGRMDGQNIEPRRALGWLALSQDRRYDAIRWMTEVAELRPADFSVAAEIARLYLELDRFDDAERVLLAYEKNNPESIEVLDYLSQIYANVGSDLENAIRYAQAAAAKSPKAGVFAWLARLNEQQGDYAAAVDALERAVQIDPSNAELLQLLALMRQKKAIQTASGEDPDSDSPVSDVAVPSKASGN